MNTHDDPVAHMLNIIDPPRDLAHEVEVALRLGSCRGSRARIPDLARRVGLNRRTLSRRFRRHGLPPPSAVMRWGALMDVMLAWSHEGETLNAVAWSRGCSGFDVSERMKDNAGMRPTEWSGDLDELCRALYGTWAGGEERAA